jgi:hypothetical protein
MLRTQAELEVGERMFTSQKSIYGQAKQCCQVTKNTDVYMNIYQLVMEPH